MCNNMFSFRIKHLFKLITLENLTTTTTAAAATTKSYRDGYSRTICELLSTIMSRNRNIDNL